MGTSPGSVRLPCMELVGAHVGLVPTATTGIRDGLGSIRIRGV